MYRSLLTCKWAIQIVLKLVEGPKRPSELVKAIKGIKYRILFDRLKRLMAAGLVGKTSSEGYPKVTYYYLKDPHQFYDLARWVSRINMPIDSFVSVMSCKWVLDIMELLREPKTPTTLKVLLTGISDKVLYERLSELEELGLAKREVLPTKPVRVIYTLSEEGRRILPTLVAMRRVILCTLRKHSPELLPERDS